LKLQRASVQDKRQSISDCRQTDKADAGFLEGPSCSNVARRGLENP